MTSSSQTMPYTKAIVKIRVEVHKIFKVHPCSNSEFVAPGLQVREQY